MGFTYANIKIQNAVDVDLHRKHQIGEEEIREITVVALVDTGSIQMCINEEICHALGLEIIGHRPSQLANGLRVMLPIVGPIKIIYEDRYSLTSALVLPGDSEALLGAIPLEEMDLLVNPGRNELAHAHKEGWLAVVK